jgi:hypothetical protein
MEDKKLILDEKTLILKKKLDIYYELKKQLACNIAIVGSSALYFQGFEDFICINKDLDIVIINPTINDINTLEDLVKSSPNDKLDRIEKYKNNKNKNYFLLLQGIEVDIFTLTISKEELEKEFISIDLNPGSLDRGEILVSTLLRIIRIKKIFNRKKDWDFLNKISSWIMKDFDINKIK